MNRPTVARSCPPLARLVLELGHPGRLAVPGDAAQHPRELGVLGHVALDEERALLRVEADRDQLGDRDEGALAQHGRVVLDGDRVQVDDAVERVVVVLQRHPLPQGTEVVAEMERVGGRLDAGQHRGRRERRMAGVACAAVRPVATSSLPSGRGTGRRPVPATSGVARRRADVGRSVAAPGVDRGSGSGHLDPGDPAAVDLDVTREPVPVELDRRHRPRAAGRAAR